MSTASSTDKYSPKILIFLGFFCYFVLVAGSRLIAQDEGFYIYAARLVSEGNLPYRDFFYPQMPLLPLIYGLFMLVVGTSWSACRMLSALFAAGTGLLLVLIMLRKFGRTTALFGSLLFISSVLVFPWYVLVQTYPLAIFLLISSWYAISIRRMPILAGVLFGLCVATRLPMAATLPAFAYEIVRGKKETWAKDIVRFVVGGALVGLPILLVLVWNSDVFLFNNLGYHMIRFGDQEEYFDQQRYKIVQILFGLRESGKFDSFQMPYLLIASLGLLLSQVLRKRWPSSILVLLLCLFFVHLTPDPPYVQYFACLIPFLIMSSAEALHGVNALAVLRRRQALRAVFQVIVVLCILHYLWGVPSDFVRHLRSGEGVIGIINAKNAASWNITATNDLSRRVDALTSPGEAVFSSWPGHIFNSHARILKGAENHFGLALTFRGDLDRQRLKSYRIISFEELSEAAHRGDFKVAVVQPSKHGALLPVLQDAGFRLVSRSPLFSIFKRQ